MLNQTYLLQLQHHNVSTHSYILHKPIRFIALWINQGTVLKEHLLDYNIIDPKHLGDLYQTLAMGHFPPGSTDKTVPSFFLQLLDYLWVWWLTKLSKVVQNKLLKKFTTISLKITAFQFMTLPEAYSSQWSLQKVKIKE